MSTPKRCGFLVLLSAGCVGGVDGGSGARPDGAIGSGSGDVDRITCTTELSIGEAPNPPGTFATAPVPADVTGCWPVGTWTFSVQISAQQNSPPTCATPPTLAPQYQFRGELDTSVEDPDNFTYKYTYLTDPQVDPRISVSSGGGGTCTAKLSFFSADGKSVLSIEPYLVANPDPAAPNPQTGEIKGKGTYEVHTLDQRE